MFQTVNVLNGDCSKPLVFTRRRGEHRNTSEALRLLMFLLWKGGQEFFFQATKFAGIAVIV